MNLSELSVASTHVSRGDTREVFTERELEVRALLGQLGCEIAATLSCTLERVVAFAASGRIDHAGLRALREEVEHARRLGLQAQQFARFASGRVRPAPQKLDLPQKLRDALAQRSRETAARGIDLRQDLRPAEIIVDDSMLTALLQALLDWSFEHARSHIEFRIDTASWPPHARLACRFAFIPADELPVPGAPALGALAMARLDTMAWHLVRQLATSLGLELGREDADGRTELTLAFPRTVGATLISLSALDDEDTVAAGLNSQPMVGRHVLVIAARRETRNSVRETLRPMGLMVDFVASVDDARQFCSASMPHAIVFEAALAGENFRRLRADWSRELPAPAFIEIGEQGRGLQVTDFAGQRTSRIGRDVVVDALPKALLLELSRAG